jgi:hypothetical protein
MTAATAVTGDGSPLAMLRRQRTTFQVCVLPRLTPADFRVVN